MRRHSAHVDPDVLAEVSAGLISGKRATRVHAHLAGCPHCARRSAGLDEISMLLASVPSPAMPESVARRLDAALAQEAAGRPARTITVAESTGQRASESVLTFRGGASKGRRRGLTSPVAARAFAAAAAVCVVAAGSYTALRLTSSGPSSPASGPAPAGAVPHRSGSSGSAAQPFIETPTHPSDLPNRPSFKVIDSGIDYRRATLSPQIKAELGKVAAINPATSYGARVLHTPTRQQYACVMDVTGGTEPALVDSARYEGRPATIIALAHVGNQVSQAWVAGPGCSGDSLDLLAHVRLPASGG